MTLPNGVQVTFGAIVALAGDFYGVPESPIIDPARAGLDVDVQNRIQRFKAAYGTLGSVADSNIQVEVNKLVEMIKEDQKAKATGGKLHSHIDWEIATMKKIANVLPITSGRMSQLAAQNFDHFQPQAEQAYLAGHTLAIKTAQEAASQMNDVDKKKKLMEAYSIEAFADHFLTDSFSAGHLRFEF